MSYKVFLKWVFKTEFVMILMALFFSVITEFMMSFVFFDEAAIVDIYGINQITGYDYRLIQVLGVSGISKQTYILIYVIITTIYFAYILLWNRLAVSHKQKDLILFYIKGYSPKESNMRLFWVRFIVYVLMVSVSVLLAVILCFVFYGVIHSDHMMILPTVWYLLPITINGFTFFLIDYLYLAKPISHKQVMQYLRENY